MTSNWFSNESIVERKNSSRFFTFFIRKIIAEVKSEMTFNNFDRRIFFLVAGGGRLAMIALGCRTESGCHWKFCYRLSHI